MKYTATSMYHVNTEELQQTFPKTIVFLIMKQDKGRGVIMDENKYTEKCLEMLNTT